MSNRLHAMDAQRDTLILTPTAFAPCDLARRGDVQFICSTVTDHRGGAIVHDNACVADAARLATTTRNARVVELMPSCQAPTA